MTSCSLFTLGLETVRFRLDASAFNRGVRNELIPDIAQGAELLFLLVLVTDGSLKKHPCQKFHQCGGLLLVQVQVAVGHLACLLRLMTKKYDGYTALGHGVCH